MKIGVILLPLTVILLSCTGAANDAGATEHKPELSGQPELATDKPDTSRHKDLPAKPVPKPQGAAAENIGISIDQQPLNDCISSDYLGRCIQSINTTVAPIIKDDIVKAVESWHVAEFLDINCEADTVYMVCEYSFGNGRSLSSIGWSDNLGMMELLAWMPDWSGVRITTDGKGSFETYSWETLRSFPTLLSRVGEGNPCSFMPIPYYLSDAGHNPSRISYTICIRFIIENGSIKDYDDYEIFYNL